MTRVAHRGISVDVPRGWDVQIRSAGPLSLRTAGIDDVDGHDAGTVLHAGSFPLPADRGDYGSGAVEIMGGSDVLVCLLEHEPEAVETPLFQQVGVPALLPAHFSPQSMQRAIAGMAGAQQFFQAEGRAFCLYVVIGSWHTRGPLVRTAAAVVRSFELSAL